MPTIVTGEAAAKKLNNATKADWTDNQKTIYKAQNSYNDQMNQTVNDYNAAIDAGIESARLEAEAGKQDAATAMTDSNRAAQQAYYQAINPFGYQSEVMAANGLGRSGLSETARISSGNAFQQALNTNRDTYNKALSDLDLEIRQAQLQGDQQKAQYLAEVGKLIAQQGVDSANQIVQAGQVDEQNAISRLETEANIAMAEKQYQLKVKELNDQLATNKITRQQAQQELKQAKKEYEIYVAYAKKQAAADLAYTQSQTKLNNRK